MGRCDFDLGGGFCTVSVKFCPFVHETLYFRYFLLNLRKRYVAIGEISVQCGDWDQ